MFTRATRHFGVWREGHASIRGRAGSPTGNFIFALAVAAFVSWLMFFFVLKIKAQFFLLESSAPALAVVKRDSSLLFPARRASIALALFRDAESKEKLVIVFDTGERFEYPDDATKVRAALKKRAESQELISMLMLRQIEGAARAQIWPSRQISSSELQNVLDFLSDTGFDDFDVAVREENSP